MQSEIIFFVWGICFNIAVSLNLPGYRQEVYQPAPYPQNTGPAYAARRPAVINYGPPQQPVINYQGSPVPKYVQNQQDAIFQEYKQESQQQHEMNLPLQLQEQVVESKLDANYVTQPAAATPRLYPEHPRLYYAPSNRNYENYGVGPMYVRNIYPQPSRPWIRDSYQSVQPIQQEPYIEGPVIAAYPTWQSSGLAIPQQSQYYSSSYGQNDYNTPVQYISEPEQQPASVASVGSENIPEIIASKPEVMEYLKSDSENKRYLIIHPNGTIEHVDVIDDRLLGNSQHFKSSDLLKQVFKSKESPVISSSVFVPVNNNENQNVAEHNKNSDFLLHSRTVVPIETQQPVPWSESEDHTKNYLRNNPESPTAIPIQSHENNVNKIISPVQTSPTGENNGNYYRNSIEHKSQADIVLTVDGTNSKIRDNVLPVNAENTNTDKSLLPYPDPTNSDHSSISSTDEVIVSNNTQNPNNLDPSPTNEEEFYNNPSGGILYLNTYSTNQNTYDSSTNEAEYVATQVHKAKDTFNQIDESTTTALPYLLNSSKQPNETGTNLKFVPPNSSDYELKTNYDQILTQESKENPSSNVQHYPDDTNPSSIDKNDDDEITDVLVQQNNFYDESTSVTDASDDDGKNDKTDPNTTNLQDNENESVLNNTQETTDESILNADEQRSLDESVDSYYSPKPVDDIAKEPVNEDFSAETPNKESPTFNNDTSNSDEKEKEGTLVTIDEIKSDDLLGENEVVVDFANFKQVNKSIFWFRPDDDFWDKLVSGNDTGGYDKLLFFNVNCVNPVIEKSSKSFVFENGTVVEEIEEILWERKHDNIPKEIKMTRVIRNPGPENARPRKDISESSKGATHSKCEP